MSYHLDEISVKPNKTTDIKYNVDSTNRFTRTIAVNY